MSSFLILKPNNEAHAWFTKRMVEDVIIKKIPLISRIKDVPLQAKLSEAVWPEVRQTWS